jgi:hypothetical protein
LKIGIIAEDDSDVAVIREITLTLLKPRAVGFRQFVGNGCGKLRRKCGAWSRTLVSQGCPWIVVVHDLDLYNGNELRLELDNAISPAGASVSVILIPKREIEAWLLFDGAAIARAFRMSQPPKLPGNPESLPDPKRHLSDIIWRKYRKDYLNTLHNALIAKHIVVSRLQGSRSFVPHLQFTAAVKSVLAGGDNRHRHRR